MFDCFFFFSTIREGLATIDLKKKVYFFSSPISSNFSLEFLSTFHIQHYLIVLDVIYDFSCSACVVVFAGWREASWCDGKSRSHIHSLQENFSQELRLFGLVFNNLSIRFLIHETFHQHRIFLLPLQFRLHTFFLFHSCLGFSFCTPRKMADQHLKGAESEWRENLHKVIHNFHWFTETASFFPLFTVCSVLLCIHKNIWYLILFLFFDVGSVGRWWWSSVLCVVSLLLSRLESTT